MINRKQNRFFSFLAFIMAFLNICTALTPVKCVAEEPTPETKPVTIQTPSEKQKVSPREVLAFRSGMLTTVFFAITAAAVYYPSKEAYNAATYRTSEFWKKKAFIKEFGETKAELVEKQQGANWDWAACLVSIVKSKVKDADISQRYFVKNVMGDASFFKHNRTEALPTACYYDMWLRNALDKAVSKYQLGEQNGDTATQSTAPKNCETLRFRRELHELRKFPKGSESRKIANMINLFYKNIAKNNIFAITDSYFYGESPYHHFVLVTKIEDSQITIEDPATGLNRTQNILEFCKGYLNEDCTPKLSSFEMFTCVPEVQK